MMNIILLIASLVCLVALSAVLSASETSMFSLSSFIINSYKTDIDKRKKLIAKLLMKPRDLLVTILMMNIISNILVQNTISSIFGKFDSWLLKVGVPLVITLLFGEVIPKSIGLPNNKVIAYHLAPFLYYLNKIVKPIRLILIKLTSYLSRILFFFLKKEKPLSFEELNHVIKESEENKMLSRDEKELIEGYLKLHDTSVKELMRFRKEVFFYDINEPIDKLKELFKEKKLSRIPVCDKSIENILGLISLKKFFINKDKINNKLDLLKILKKPFYVPDTMKSWILINKLRNQQENIAVVVDEYGSIAGIITQEDLTEQIIGEIKDDKDPSQKYTFSSKDIIIASGKLELDEIEDIFGVEFARSNIAVTIGGYLTEKKGEIPQAGTRIETTDFVFYVLSSDPTRVRRVYIKFKGGDE